MSRLPIRVRLTLAFAAVMALVLVVVGSLLYVRLGASLLEQIDDSLESRAQAFDASREAATTAGDEQVVQLLAADGEVIASSPSGMAALVSASDLARAAGDVVFLERKPVSEDMDGLLRLRLSPAAAGGRRAVLVVGASLEDRNEALDGLLAELGLVGPLALLLSSAAGYLLAAGALRPVESMRRRAQSVSSERAGQRLPLPRARDEIHRLGGTLNEMLARLEAGLARERRFVADASHELRTPLSLLQTELELALRRPRSGEELAQALRSAAEEVDRLVRLAADLLVLARSDDGSLPLERSPHIVREVLDAVAGRFDPRARELGRDLVVDASSDWVLIADRLRVEQALGNLVDNALRHGAGTVGLSAARDDGMLDLRVTDEGAGFPAEFLPHAFERFSRVDVARSGGGAGLGLAIVAAVAQAHGGTAVAGNAPGGGAEVTLRLPEARAAPPVDPHRLASQRL